MDTSTIYNHETDPKMEEFIRVMYSSDDEKEPEMSSIIHVQHFRRLAGVKTKRTKDEWLEAISVNATLNAFSIGASQFYNKFGTHSLEKAVLIANLLVETDRCDNQLLNDIILEVINKDCLQVTQLIQKVIRNANSGSIQLRTPTLMAIFEKDPSLFEKSIEELVEVKENEVHNFWLVKAAQTSPDLYSKVCREIQTKCMSFLPIFIRSMSISGNIIQFYPPHEQPCVLLSLIPENTDPHIKGFHVTKVMDELLQLWQINPKSVIKLLDHFPQLIDWLMHCCHKDVNAQRLCLHLISSPPQLSL